MGGDIQNHGGQLLCVPKSPNTPPPPPPPSQQQIAQQAKQQSALKQLEGMGCTQQIITETCPTENSYLLCREYVANHSLSAGFGCKGPGLIESIYERCLMHQLSLQKLAAVNQQLVRIRYKDLEFDEPLRFDVLVEDCLLIEVKSVERILPVHKAQLLSYMKLLNIPVGLLSNFHESILKNGNCRLILPGANQL